MRWLDSCRLPYILYGISLLISGLTGDSSVYNLVYQDIDSRIYDKCVRLLNGTHQIGCQSSMSGDVGVLFHMNDSSQMSDIVNGEHAPYIIILHANLLSKSIVLSLKTSGKVNGIVVYSNDDYSGKAGGWSPELKCPKSQFSLYNSSHGAEYANCYKNPWNALGDGLTEEDIGFPVFILKDYETAKSMIDCYNIYNVDNEYPLCAAQMKSRMDGAQNTETCTRRNALQDVLSPARYCDPLGGRTILATLQVTNNSDVSPKPAILVASAFDSRSFETTSTSPGANSATGFITLLSIAQALGKLDIDVKDAMNANVMFILFDGEAFDYMGSSRMVYEMSKGDFPYEYDKEKWFPAPFNLSDILYWIELGQVGHISEEAIMHFDPISKQDAKTGEGIDEVMSALQNSTTELLSFKSQSPDIGLVPSSLHSALRKENVSGVVITDFDKSYLDRSYFSRYDTLDKLVDVPRNNASEDEVLLLLQPLALKLANLSTATAKAVYKLATGGKNNSNILADDHFIARVLYCYLYNSNCSLFAEALEVNATLSGSGFINRYVGVYKEKLKPSAVLARNILAMFVGENLGPGATEDSCKANSSDDGVYRYLAFSGIMYNMTGNFCIRATVYDLDGRSPSAILTEYDYSAGPYGAWTESNWGRSAMLFRIFLLQDKVSQGLTLLSGLLMFSFSLIIMYIINRKSEILFGINEIL